MQDETGQFRNHIHKQVSAAFTEFVHRANEVGVNYDPNPEIGDVIDRGLSVFYLIIPLLLTYSSDNYVACYIFVQHRREMETYTGPQWTNLNAIFILPVELLALVRMVLPSIFSVYVAHGDVDLREAASY